MELQNSPQSNTGLSFYHMRSFPEKKNINEYRLDIKKK